MSNQTYPSSLLKPTPVVRQILILPSSISHFCPFGLRLTRFWCFRGARECSGFSQTEQATAHSLPREWRRRGRDQQLPWPITRGAHSACAAVAPPPLPPPPRRRCGRAEHSSSSRGFGRWGTRRHEPRARRIRYAHDNFQGHVRWISKVILFSCNILAFNLSRSDLVGSGGLLLK